MATRHLITEAHNRHFRRYAVGLFLRHDSWTFEPGPYMLSGESMFSLAKKIVLLAVVSVVAYKALGFYVFYTFANSVIPQCASLEDFASLKNRKASGPEVERFMHTAFTCVKAKQNFIQAHYFPVPDMWLNPPPGSVTYKDIPDF